ncbi:uncharacterized protein EV154DRAFT_486946 [Mucor mucedo]|uniref:uncharacterized protein n=1 Tax=Mucor mucedo TaxID=29922 RepID=UPI00221FDB60|nr:uncharacterized protein EV154DRAFT_486946 [Mucor mucedo]KAI7874264.1 hypothetical protein EV154DRAFT_486946 [Mucor mucedo]
MTFHRINQYKEKKAGKVMPTAKSHTSSKISIDRPLPRAPAPGNFNVNYTTLEVRIPNYTFGKAKELAGAGGLIAVCLGKRHSDGIVVLAKVSPHSVRLEREFYVSKRMHSLAGGEQFIADATEYVSLVQDGLAAIIYSNVKQTDCIYFEQDQKLKYQSLYSLGQLTNTGDFWKVPVESCIPRFINSSLDMFLDFAIECCSALQFLHENGVVHGELRPSAFQCGYTDGKLQVKIWNFGGGLNSYEELLLTSSRWRSFMATTDGSSNTNNSLIPTPPPLPPVPITSRFNPHLHDNLNEEPNYFSDMTVQNRKPNSSRFYSPKEFQTSLIYVSPEQTGRTSNALDHRADLYSLGIMFYVILTDRAPFEGSAMDVVHSILSKNVPLVHTIRKDIPPVISSIIDKLTRKTVDERYDSAYGLREDLIECKKRVAALNPDESLVFFPLGLRDVNPVFKISDRTYGRNRETELISNIIQNTYTIHQVEKRKTKENDIDEAKSTDIQSSTLKEADTLLRTNASTSLDNSSCQVIVLKGPGGIGKTTLVTTLNAQARHCGYTASAKFDKNQKRPYNGLLRCLSSILRQLLTESEHVVREFYKDLKDNLGPQFSNVRLMVNMVPELRPILYDYREKVNVPDDDALSSILNTETRFHAVFLNIIRCIARKKMITLCLDDLQEADEPSIHLISALILSRTTMLVILTFRDGDETPRRVIEILEKCGNPVTIIQLYPLGNEVLRDMVLDTFYNTHRTTTIQSDLAQEREDRLNVIQPLVDIIYSWTRGNPFYAKQFLKTMKRKEDIWFDWAEKHWKFRLDNITKLFNHSPTHGKKTSNHEILMMTGHLENTKNSQELFDVRNLVSHLRSLDSNSQHFLMWASLIGHVFNFRRIKWLMMAGDITSDDNSSASSKSDAIGLEEEEKRSSQAILGLQTALSEGIVQFKAGNDFHFIHDRYYQAASMLILDPVQRETMHLKIGQMLMLEEEVEEDDNVFLIADHFVKSARLIRFLDKTKCYRDVLIRAGNEATLSGALQISATYYECAISLLNENIEQRWVDGPDSFFSETLNLYMKTLELNWLKNTEDESTTHDISADTRESMLKQIMEHTQDFPVERAQAWRIQARIFFQQSEYRKGIHNILQGLEELGIVVDLNITDEGVLQYYHDFKPSITKPGLEILSKLGPCQNQKQMAIMTLLNEACTGAYWVNPILVDFFALKLCELSLRHGYTPASGGGFIWVGCTATRASEFTFAAQLGQFGVAISEKYAGNSEIARAIIVHHAMLAQWTGVHVREYIYQYQRAYKYALAGGDMLFSSMALFHVASTLYWTSCNLSELHWHLNHSMEECDKGSSKDVMILNISLWRSVLVFQGKTNATDDPEKLMNDPDSNFDEPSFVEDLKSQSINSGNPLNWHYSFKMILLFHFGFTKAASELGFKIFDNSVNEAVHRHVGIAMYYHSIAVVESLRDPSLDPEIREKYTCQLQKNRKRLSELADHSEVNYRMYQKIVEAEVSTMENDMPRTLKLYDEVIELGLKGNWYSFSGLTFELAAQYYMRSGLSMLAIPLLSRSIEFYARWGAFGKVEYLKKKYKDELKTQSVSGSEDMAVQTEDVIVGTTTVIDKVLNVWDNNSDGTTPDSSLKELYNNENPPTAIATTITQEEAQEVHEETLFSLDMVDLTSIIKSSQVISNEMNSFDELLKKMIGIIMINSGAESGAIIIKEGFFGIAAYSIRSTEPTCQTFEPPIPLRDDDDKITTSIVHYVIHTHTNLFIPNVEDDSRFATGSNGQRKCAVICMPIMHKSTIVGVLYLQANLNTFTNKHANVLALLCDQIGISITNALLFKSVQKATKANALMIESQLKALEEARASREQALRATKMKSNFLANMSHELRTPFSGFYGMISLLSETRLDAEQREFVSIAKQSCEMLLHIIDDLLDFSKLEAHKVKLHYGLFYIEDLIADRMELLITLATNKNVELSYFIDADVPSIVYGDGNRIGQILMNLIGNAIKFTHHGEVVVRCGIDNDVNDPDHVTLKISVQDTGIGMTEDEIKGLFLPFSQVDGSTTRNFGGTGLGLSICLQLVRLMHGDIQVKSTRDIGSLFTFKIRVKNGASVAEPNADDPRASSMNLLITQLGQPRILMVCFDRVKSMIESFIPWIERLENRANMDDAISLALRSAAQGIPYDCIIIDSPLTEAMTKLVAAIEKNPQLQNMRVLLLIAPTVENIRRHFANSGITNSNESPRLHQVFHPSVTQLSKPVRRAKLLTVLVKLLSSPVVTIVSPSESADYKSSEIVSPVSATTTKRLNIGLRVELSPYSTQGNQGFLPEELAIFKGQRILVAEDNFIAQRLIVKQLAKLGFVVDKCNNGFECFDTWKSKDPGYYILAWIDHHMPGCDGLEATRMIRRYEKEMNCIPALPIIALTADIQSTAQDNCFNAGMNDYVTKPLMQKDLATILRKYCLGPTII